MNSSNNIKRRSTSKRPKSQSPVKSLTILDLISRALPDSSEVNPKEQKSYSVTPIDRERRNSRSKRLSAESLSLSDKLFDPMCVALKSVPSGSSIDLVLSDVLSGIELCPEMKVKVSQDTDIRREVQTGSFVSVGFNAVVSEGWIRELVDLTRPIKRTARGKCIKKTQLDINFVSDTDVLISILRPILSTNCLDTIQMLITCDKCGTTEDRVATQSSSTITDMRTQAWESDYRPTFEELLKTPSAFSCSKKDGDLSRARFRDSERKAVAKRTLSQTRVGLGLSLSTRHLTMNGM
ncbi:hypothetical protein DFJ73DRAFT_761310 [Zopfochytrium polystomum]|nr:hypothetical protein DFJ73DRAFT_761310 [Zopfochytrium polystomum]